MQWYSKSVSILGIPSTNCCIFSSCSLVRDSTNYIASAFETSSMLVMESSVMTASIHLISNSNVD